MVRFVLPGTRVVLHANDKYSSPKKAHIKTVRCVLTDPNAAIAQLQTGEADFVWSVPPSQVPVLRPLTDHQGTSTQNKIYAQFNVIKYPAYKDERMKPGVQLRHRSRSDRQGGLPWH